MFDKFIIQVNLQSLTCERVNDDEIKFINFSHQIPVVHTNVKIKKEL